MLLVASFTFYVWSSGYSLSHPPPLPHHPFHASIIHPLLLWVLLCRLAPLFLLAFFFMHPFLLILHCLLFPPLLPQSCVSVPAVPAAATAPSSATPALHWWWWQWPNGTHWSGLVLLTDDLPSALVQGQNGSWWRGNRWTTSGVAQSFIFLRALYKFCQHVNAFGLTDPRWIAFSSVIIGIHCSLHQTHCCNGRNNRHIEERNDGRMD